MTAHMKKQHLRTAIVGVIEPIKEQIGFTYKVVTNVPFFPGVVMLVISEVLEPSQSKRIRKALNLIKTDGVISFRDDNGFY